MPNTTSRLALQEPIGADPASELRFAITNHAVILDNAALYTEGTMVGRPDVTTVEHGHIYRATDIGASGTVFVNTGSTWILVGPADTGWTAFSGINFVPYSFAPAACRVLGDRVYLKGALQATANVPPGTIISVLPIVLANPPVPRFCTCGVSTGTPADLLSIDTGGHLRVTGQTILNNGIVYFDSVSYSLS